MPAINTFRYSTKKIGWTMACLHSIHNDMEDLTGYSTTYLYTTEGEQLIQACYETPAEELPPSVERNLLMRNLRTTHGDKYGEVRIFQMEIEEVCRRTLAEIYAMKKVTALGITGEDLGLEPAMVDGWRKGYAFMLEGALLAMEIASDFSTREEFILAYKRAVRLFGTWKEFRELPGKDGCEVRLSQVTWKARKH